MMNEGRWIIVTNAVTGRRQAVNLGTVTIISENSADRVADGKRTEIGFVSDTYIDVSESFDEIGAMIR